MKLALSNCGLFSYIKEGLSDFDALQTIRNSGFRLVDYNMTQENFMNPVKCGRALKESLDQLEMQAFTAHAPNFNPVLPENRVKWESMHTVLTFCREAGIPSVVVHPGGANGNTREEFFENNVAFYQSFIPVCEETGVRVLLENIGNYADPYYLFNGHDVKEMLAMIDHPLFGLCWDTGHANHFCHKDCDQYESIVEMGSDLEVIHFQDNAGYFSDSHKHHRIDMHMAPYMTWTGSVNYDAVIKGLVDIGFQGPLNFELTATWVRSNVDPFVLDGQVYDRLRLLPLSLCETIYRTVHDIGRYMLEAYGVFEE